MYQVLLTELPLVQTVVHCSQFYNEPVFNTHTVGIKYGNLSNVWLQIAN